MPPAGNEVAAVPLTSDELGLLCRLDDRGEPVIQLSPPLVSTVETLDRIVDIVTEAVRRANVSWQEHRATTRALPSPQVA